MISKNKTILFSILLNFLIAGSFAQVLPPVKTNFLTVDTVAKPTDSLASQVDIIDILHHLLHKSSLQTTIKPEKKFNFSIVPSAGYTYSTGFSVGLTGNVAFYAEPAKHENISAVTSFLSYNQRNQIIFHVVHNIWSKNNDYNFVGDLRWYKFPDNTYGLGSLTTLDQLTHVQYNYIRFYETVLKKLSNNFYGGLGYDLNYHYDITEDASNQNITDYDRYGKTSKSISSAVTFDLLFDNRKNSINPQNGTYINLIYRPNLKLLGSDVNWQSLSFDLRKYIKLSQNNHSILAFWTLDNFTLNGHPPYFDLPSTGWDMTGNMGRGYMQSRFRGTNMLYAEAAYRFVLTNNGLLGGVLFINGQSFTDYPQNRFQRIAPGFGPGLRVKFNKHSDTNICFDYGFGTNGSRGLFVNLGEVF